MASLAVLQTLPLCIGDVIWSQSAYLCCSVFSFIVEGSGTMELCGSSLTSHVLEIKSKSWLFMLSQKHMTKARSHD